MVITHPSHAFKIVKDLSQLINPALVIALVVGLVLLWRQDKTRFWGIFIAAVVSVVIAYLIKNVEGHHHVWAHWGMNFSSHSALAIVCLTALAFIWQRRWWIFALIFVAYAIFMIMMQFHSVADILTTSAVVFPICWVCQFVPWWRNQPNKIITAGR